MTSHLQPRSIGLVAALLLCVAFANTASAKPAGPSGNASFPEVKDSWSPDARFVLKNVDSTEDPKKPPTIFLTDMKTGERTQLHSYARKADVLWSPSSDAVAINDWDADDEAQCIVFRLVPTQQRYDLREEFLKSRRPEREKKLAADRRDYDYNFAHLIRWLNGNTLLFVVEGHSSDGKHLFHLEYAYRLGDSFQLRSRIVR